MICPNCGQNFDRGNHCPRCRMDTVLFSGTVRISDNLYNKGLAKLKVNDLSGGIESLTKSIEFNKNNILAHNLLGLTLYETGHVGDALKHWVISCALVKENNPATQYIDDVQKNVRFLERMNDAIRMYNQALEYIRQKSDDMAIIQLKKAVELNPKFIDALNLLTLCYLIQRDRDKASQTTEKVLSIDVNNTLALQYFREIHPNKIKPELRSKKAATQTAAPPSTTYQKVAFQEKKTSHFHIAEILSFIIGALCMFGALYVLVLPAVLRENEKQVDDYRMQLTAAEESNQRQVDTLSAEILEREDRVVKLEAEVAEWSEKMNVQERTNKVLNAYGMLTDNKYQEAVDILADISTEGLAFDIVEKAESIYQTAYPKLAQSYYDQGVAAFDRQKDYVKAQVDLEKAYRYVAEDATIRADVLYYLGSVYALNEETAEDAKKLLSTLVEEYPRYRRFRDATQKLNKLG